MLSCKEGSKQFPVHNWSVWYTSGKAHCLPSAYSSTSHTKTLQIFKDVLCQHLPVNMRTQHLQGLHGHTPLHRRIYLHCKVKVATLCLFIWKEVPLNLVGLTSELNRIGLHCTAGIVYFRSMELCCSWGMYSESICWPDGGVAEESSSGWELKPKVSKGHPLLSAPQASILFQPAGYKRGCFCKRPHPMTHKGLLKSDQEPHLGHPS